MIGMQTALKELGVEVDDVVIAVATDSSAAKSFASRRGSGRIRHIETKWLWLQQVVRDGKVRLRKIPGTKNPADICTKYKNISDIKSQLAAVNVIVEEKGARRCLPTEGSGGRSFWARLQDGEPRVVWADAADSDSDGVGEVETVGSNDA